MNKNTVGQKWRVFAFDRSTSAPKLGDAANITAQLSKDFGAEAAVTDTNPTEIGGGYYEFDISQEESNADVLHLRPASSTASISVVPCPVMIVTTSSIHVTSESVNITYEND